MNPFNKKIVIWGAGSQGQRAIMDLEFSLDDIAFFVDRSTDLQKEGFVYLLSGDRKKVYSPNVLKEIDCKEYGWIIATAAPESIKEKLDADIVLCYPDDFFEGRGRGRDKDSFIACLCMNTIGNST